jgi:hypothetical protein
MLRAQRRRTIALVSFALLALVAEVTGRSITSRLDRALHVRPFTSTDTSYYPFLLAGVKVAAAVGLAALAWRVARARATAAAGERLLAAIGHRAPRRAPKMRLRLSGRLWLASFSATSLWYLLQTDVERLAGGRWPLLAPWLHTSALPVFAVLAVVAAVGWHAVTAWVAEYEQYAEATLACARRMLRPSTPALLPRRANPTTILAPRSLFGLAFESRPPPLAV